MAGCNSYYCNDLEEQVLTPCGENLPGGADQAVVFACGSEPTDPTDGVEIAAIIAAGNAVLFQNIKCGIAKPTAQDGTALVAGQEARTQTYQRTGTWMDGNVNANSDTAYEAINNATGQRVGAILWHLAEQDAGLSLYANPYGGIAFKGGKNVPDDTAEPIRYEYDLSWRSKTDVQVVTTPSGVFV